MKLDDKTTELSDNELDVTKFSYSAYRKLKKNLGEFDAVVECNEIAIREFVEQVPKENLGEYIKRLSEKHKVKVDEVDVKKFDSRIRQYYVLSVFQQFEQFLKDFKIEWKKYFSEKQWVEPRDGETKLKNTLDNISLNMDTDIIDIYEYYRLIRNYMSHTDRDKTVLSRKHSKVVANKNDWLATLKLENRTPHRLQEIDFSDFLIITNVIKHISYLISTHSKPDNKLIAEILFDKLKASDAATLKGLKNKKNNDTRFRAAISTFASTIFGRFSTSDMKEISQTLIRLLA